MATIAEAIAEAQKSLASSQSYKAEQICRQIVKVHPAEANAWLLLGAACDNQGKFADAESHYRQVVRLQPNYAQGHVSLGNAFTQQNKLPDAVASYLHALELCPSDAQTHYNLGVVLAQQGQLEEAITHYRQAVQLNPEDMEAHNNLGNALRLRGLPEEAAASHQQALRLQPDSPTIINNLAVDSIDQGNFTDAVGFCHQALRINPNLAEPYTNLGQVRKQQGRFDEALANFDKAIAVNPDHAEARWNRSLLWLLRGEWERGWADYEWRWQQPGRVRPASSQPLWDGSRLDGRSIFLGAEQGLGDTIQFIRYAMLVKACSGKVIVECPPALTPILANVKGVDQWHTQNSPLPSHDVQAPLLSLPGILGTNGATIPADIPYLTADAALMEYWRSFLEPLWGFKVGIAWQGNPRFCDDRRRSIPLAHFAPLAGVNGVRLVSLQKGPGIDQLNAVAGQFQILDLASTLDETRGPFMDTAAVMKHLDLVICSDSAVAHLAGALGVPVWLALPVVPDWRWLLAREDSPWYPTMRLFRQSNFDEWEDVFKRMAEELKIVTAKC